MNHTGHVVGGMIAGGAVCFLASTTGDVELGWGILNEMAESPLSPNQNNDSVRFVHNYPIYGSLSRS